jgi:hypothetical protein
MELNREEKMTVVTELLHPDFPIREWTFTNKRYERWDWGRGAWLNEADKYQYVDAATGLDCLIHRNGTGALCGYVGVPESHPMFATDYENVSVEVHGGLTYSDFCQVRHHSEPGEEDGSGICHVAYNGRGERIWWLGFDCAHGWDVSPSMEARYSTGGTYKTVGYVMREIAKLAAQLRAMETN